MSMEDFMSQFGGGGEVAPNTKPSGSLQSALAASNESTLDAFVDKFSGVTEPYFFYYVDGEPTIELRFQTDEHVYYLVGELGQLTPQDGVTTICHIIDKSTALVPWSAKMVVQKLLRTMPTHIRTYIKENEEEEGTTTYIPEMTLEAFEKIALDAKSAPRDKLEEAGDVGHMAHTWLEYYIKSILALKAAESAGDVAAIAEHKQAIESKLANLPGDERAANCVKAALAWMEAHHIEWIETERKIYSKKYGYAGTMDGLALVSSCNDPACCMEHFTNRLSIIDWKSSNYLYIEYLYQTAAYESAYEEEFGTDVVDRWIIRLGKEDGEFDTWHCGPEDFQEDIEGFLDALSLSRSVKMTNERMRSQKQMRKEVRKKVREEAKEAEKAQRKEARAALVAANRAQKAIEKEAKKVSAKAERAALKASLMGAIGYGTDASIVQAAEALMQTVAEDDATASEELEVLSDPEYQAEKLSAADAKVFVDALLFPPAPNEALKEAAKNALADNRLAGLPEPSIASMLPEEKVVTYQLPQLPQES